MTSHRKLETLELGLGGLEPDHNQPSAKAALRSGADATDQYLHLLRAEDVAAGRTPPINPDEADYFVEVRNPDQLVGATAIVQWKFGTGTVTNVLRKRVYNECSVWGEEAGYHRVGKNRIALWKSKYRAFRARMNGGVS